MLYCSHFTVISVSYVVLAVLCAWRIIILCTACLNVWWRIIPPVFHPLGTATSLSLAAVCEPQMIETQHENDVDAILITILILCKSTEVYRRAPRPPDPRWWEQEGPTGLTHPIQTTNLGFPQVEQLWNLGGVFLGLGFSHQKD